MREKKTQQQTVEQRTKHEEHRARVAANQTRRKAVEEAKANEAWKHLEMFEEEITLAIGADKVSDMSQKYVK